MNSYAPILEWIDTQAAQMRQCVTDWANVNSGTGNVSGIEKMIALLRPQLARLGGELLLIPLPTAKIPLPTGSPNRIQVADPQEIPDLGGRFSDRRNGFFPAVRELGPITRFR